MTAELQPVCIYCCATPVGPYELLCAKCEPTAKALGLIDPDPVPDTRVQIGPTDV